MENKKRGAKVSAWTNSKIAEIKRLYPVCDTPTVAEKMGMTVRAIRSAAMKFKIKKSNRYWDKPETDYILKHWPTSSVQEIADGLKRKFGLERTKWAIINKYRELTGKRP